MFWKLLRDCMAGSPWKIRTADEAAAAGYSRRYIISVCLLAHALNIIIPFIIGFFIFYFFMQQQ